MSIADHHRLRMKEGLTWRGEFALAIIEEEGEIKTSILTFSGLNYHGLREVVEKLLEGGFIKKRSTADSRVKLLSLTEKGSSYLQQVKELYK